MDATISIKSFSSARVSRGSDTLLGGLGSSGGRNSKYGKCIYCNEYNTQPSWCLSCDPDMETRWTSRNKAIDDCIKQFQLRAYIYEETIEWIPFNRLTNVKEIGKGGFGSVYSATWLDGMRQIEENKIGDNKNYSYKRSRKPFSTVALKTLSGSLKEFENHITCGWYGSKLKIYGLTQKSESEYLMVFQYADNGNLHKFLRNNFRDLTWQTKIKLLEDVSYDLLKIHYAGYVHADFHSGNILQDKGISKALQSYVADLGLSKKEVKVSNDDIYGVMPFVAPEVLLGQKFTKAADVYGFGVIMAEMSTGQRPFDGYEFNTSLAIKICKGLRPEFASGTPDCYIKFAKQCMDSDQKKRPTSSNVYSQLTEWTEIMKSSDDENEIKKQFLEADKIAKELPIILPKHPDIMYTSKIINTQKISDEVNAIKDTLPSESINSVENPSSN